MTKPERFQYVPDGRVLNEFFWDRAPVSIIQGPVGSGTSTACCMKMLRIAMEQAPDRNGIRRSRWLIVRNTFDDLKGTTLKTWKFWFEQIAQGIFGEVKMTNPPEHNIRWNMPDGTILDMENLFLSLDQEEDIRKLLSREPTGIWFNEVQFAEKAIFDVAHSRAMQGRYPPKVLGGPTWKGVIADLNAPPEGHWIPYMRGDVAMPEDWDEDVRRAHRKPHDWKFFLQPPGLIEVIANGRVVDYEENTRENRIAAGLPDVDAVSENGKWLTEPYKSLIGGKDKAFIDTYVMNRTGMYRAGKPVFESFRMEVNVAKEKIAYDPLRPLIVGLDFARNPAMVVCQELRGALHVLDEYGVVNESAVTYAPKFRSRLYKRFPEAFSASGAGIRFWGDPTGDSRGQGTDKTPYQIFLKHGMQVIPSSNSISLRLAAVESLLNKMVDGGPGLLIDPGCIMLKTGLNGGYHYAKVRGTNSYKDEPNKAVRYADFADALQYAAMGAGFGFQAVSSGKKPEPKRIERKAYSLRHRR